MRIKRPSLRASRATFEALESRQLLTVTPLPLADINTQQSGNPSDFVEFDDRLFYVATRADYGRELWSTDGTAAGTQLVADIWPGTGSSNPDNLTVSGGLLYFTAHTNEAGWELWRTDGTASGTQIVRDIAPGSSSGLSSSTEMVDVAGTLFFVADDGTDEGLWKTDGTEAGTELVKVISTWAFSISELTAVGDTLFFIGDDNVHGDELWKSDGTAAGTVMVKDIRPGSFTSFGNRLIEFGGELYFEANDGVQDGALWKSDGTLEGTTRAEFPAATTLPGSSPFEVSGDWLYFMANTSASGNELWKTDGTLAGTSMVADLVAGSSGSSPANFTDVDGTLFFTATVDGSLGLWKTDGTAAGTMPLASLMQNGIAPTIRAMEAYGGNLYFLASSSVFGVDLWRSNGTPFGTLPLQSGVAPAGTGAMSLAVAADQLFFPANTGGTGLELWRTNGDYSGTKLVTDFSSSWTDSSDPADFVTVGSQIFFTANDGYGQQLWVSNGSPGSALRLTHSAYGIQSSLIEQLTPIGDLLYFVGSDINGQRYLGVSDGTPLGTRRLDWPTAMSQPRIIGLTEFEGGVIFTVDDAVQGMLVFRADELHVELVAVLGTSWSPPPNYGGISVDPVVWQGKFYFLAGSDIWQTDGTEAGTMLLRTLVPEIGYTLASLTATDSALYFVSLSGGPFAPPGLWRTDGTIQGTFHFTGVPVPEKMIGVGDNLFFTAPYGFGGKSLWVTDGTIPGTTPLTDIYDDNLYLTNSDLMAVVFDGELYFFGTGSQPGGNGVGLWRSDGTPLGTSRVLDVAPFASPGRQAITVAGERILYASDFGLYMSDGTAEGTELLVPYLGLSSSELASLPRNLAELNGKLYLPQWSAEFGVEPFYVTIPVPATVVGRHLFYNQSKYDGLSAALNEMDDEAIAVDKTPYFAGGGTAGFENLSNYARGINGLMIDIANVPPASSPERLRVEDFVFRVGTTNDVGSWTVAPVPNDFAVRVVPGPDGDVHRVSVRWNNNVIQNTWLEVTVLANSNTGLETPDVFYFGNLMGESGSSIPPNTFVTSAADEVAVRNNVGFLVPITNPYDFNRDKLVSASDSLLPRFLPGFLPRLNVPLPETVPAPLAAAAGEDEMLVEVLVAAALPGALSSTGEDRDGTANADGLTKALAQAWMRFAADAESERQLEDGLLGALAARPLAMGRGRRL